MNYKEIADWFNENGYTTVRGKRLRNANTHPTLKKKKMNDEKHNLLFPSSLTNCSIEITDKRTLIHKPSNGTNVLDVVKTPLPAPSNLFFILVL